MDSLSMKNNITTLVVAVCCWIFSVYNFVSPAVAEELGVWTGKHARLAWVQDQGKGA